MRLTLTCKSSGIGSTRMRDLRFLEGSNWGKRAAAISFLQPGMLKVRAVARSRNGPHLCACASPRFNRRNLNKGYEALAVLALRCIERWYCCHPRDMSFLYNQAGSRSSRSASASILVFRSRSILVPATALAVVLGICILRKLR
jgi:ribosome biogenesis protein Nip4